MNLEKNFQKSSSLSFSLLDKFHLKENIKSHIGFFIL
jgi:hypothetical protein